MIFVSYSRYDKTPCDEIVRALQDKGFKVWQDTENLRGGDKYRAKIETAILGSDVFIILLSKRPSDFAQKELEFADKNKKRIIGIRLKPDLKLPEGYDMILGGSHQIDLADGFDSGLERLFEALEEALGAAESEQPPGPRSLWQRTVRKAQRFRAVVANSNLGPAVLKYGGAIIAGAAAVAVAVAKNNEQQRSISLQRYRDTVSRILKQYMNELALTGEMTPGDYLREFRPRVRQLLGRLEGMEVPTEAFKEKHRKLSENLQRTIEEYDDAFEKLGEGDAESCRRAVQRFTEALGGTLQNYLTLLDRTG